MSGGNFYLEVVLNSTAAWTLTYVVFSTVLFGALTLIARLRPLASSSENRAWRIALVAAPALTTGRIAAEHVGLDGAVGPDVLVVAGATGRVILAVVVLSGVVVLFLTARLWRVARGELHALRNRAPLEDDETTAVLTELAAEVGRRPPSVTRSAALRGPVAIGSNEICLPADFRERFPTGARRAMLAHELGHLVHRDPRWRAAAHLLERLLFFQPLQRLATRRLRETSEFIADEFAVRYVGRAEALVEGLMALMGAPPDRTMRFAAAFSPGSLLLRRIRRALSETSGPPPVRPRVMFAVGVLLFAAAWASPAVVPAHDCQLISALPGLFGM